MSDVTYRTVCTLGCLKLGDLADYQDLAVIGNIVKRWNPAPEAVKQLADADFLIAYEEEDGYDGSAVYLFWYDGKLYYVEGSHCSCMGFEDQWQPEETTLEAMAMKHFFMFNDEDRDKATSHIQAYLAAAKDTN